jgi:hypothetical protein
VHDIGITGHIHLTRATARLVRDSMLEHLRRRAAPVHGVTCLAPGSDQIFVEVLGRLGGTYDVVVPSRDHRRRLTNRHDRRRFDALLAGARETVTGPFDHAGPDAYAFANAQLVARCRELFAVWDGREDDRLGTTAHAVGLAVGASVPVTRIWPAGARRSRRGVRLSMAERVARPLAVGSATS